MINIWVKLQDIHLNWSQRPTRHTLITFDITHTHTHKTLQHLAHAVPRTSLKRMCAHVNLPYMTSITITCGLVRRWLNVSHFERWVHELRDNSKQLAMTECWNKQMHNWMNKWENPSTHVVFQIQQYASKKTTSYQAFHLIMQWVCITFVLFHHHSSVELLFRGGWGGPVEKMQHFNLQSWVSLVPDEILPFAWAQHINISPHICSSSFAYPINVSSSPVYVCLSDTLQIKYSNAAIHV